MDSNVNLFDQSDMNDSNNATTSDNNCVFSNLSNEQNHHHVSVSSIIESDTISTIMDSDSDCESIVTNKKNNDFGVIQINQRESLPPINSVIVSDSKDVTLGNRNIYEGPVVIKNIIYGQHLMENNKTQNVNGNNPSSSGKDHPSGHVAKLFTCNTLSNKCKCFILVSCIFILTCVFAGLMVFILRPSTDEFDLSKVRYITRNEWNAKTIEGNYSRLELPITRVIIGHTDQSPCHTKTMCTLRVKDVEYLHVDINQWEAIGYNFLVGGDGNVFEGCGWDIEGAHTYHFNKRSIAIAFIGNFENVKPPDQQLAAAQYVIHEGIRLRKLDTNFKIFGQRDLQATISPGDMLYNIIITWDHFSKDL